MNETPVIFESEDLILEGRITYGDPTQAAVLTHPHPQYGGDMQNPVVQSMTRIYQKKGYTTLRFNFRGAGKSQGRYAEGQGEIRDLSAAFAFLEKQGYAGIHLAGYSFGAWVNARAAGNVQPAGQILVAPPAALMDFSQVDAIAALKLVVAGSEDEFAPPRRIAPLVRKWEPSARFHVIEGADHFLFGHLDELEAVLSAEIPGAADQSGD